MPISDIAEIDITRIDLNLLPVLVVLLEERSVTRTARRLHLTQSTVSGMLARLRAALDDPLFVRGQRGILPTPRAEALLGPLRSWIVEANRLIAVREFDASEWRATVALAATDYTQHVLLKPFLRALRDAAPRLRVAIHSLVFEEVDERLVRGTIDLAISAEGWVPADLPSASLMRERYVLAMWSGHPLARRRRVTLDQFCHYDHLLVSPSGGAFAGPVDDALARLDRRRSVRASVPSFALVPDLLVGSELLCVTPERMVRDRPGIRICAPPFESPEVQMLAIWHPRLSDDPGHRWLRTRLAETARAL